VTHPRDERPTGRGPTAMDIARGRDLSGRTMIVTGSNTGIGFETARALAATGARVILACRRDETGQAAAQRIQQGHPGADVAYRKLDLASLASVRAFVGALDERSIDVVVCNAGVYVPRYEETEDGFEKTVGVCHVGHFALVTGLIDRLRAAGASRVVMVSSESHRSPRTLDFDRFPLRPERYRPLVAYGQAKLCNVLFANELTRRHAADGIVASSLHPGTLMATDITRSSVAATLLMTLARPFSKSLAQGAATSVYCAIAPELEGIGGRYYRDCAEGRMSAGARDAQAAARLWQLTEGWLQRPC
jgi:WW domain-containing oxidoreductase